MAPIKRKTTVPKKHAIKRGEARVVKRPARGFHRFRSGILNVTPKGNEKEVVKSNQASPLLRLPPELRHRIWELVLGGQTLLWLRADDKDNIHGVERMVPRASDRALGLDLLRTCRQIYSETALLPYKLNTFSFNSYMDFKPHLATLARIQCRQITDIQLHVPTQAGLLWTTHRFASYVTRFQKRQLKLLPALKRLQILVFEPQGLSTASGPYMSEAIRNAHKQLDTLFATKDLAITFEEMKMPWYTYKLKWDDPTHTTVLF